jgi:integrase
MPAFGHRRLDAITRQQVREFIAAKAQVYSSSYVRSLHKDLHVALAQAVGDELITNNPASRMGKMLSEKSNGLATKVQGPFTSHELRQYLAAAQAHYPDYYVLFLLLCRTGMRLGEALALKWGDIQFGVDDTDTRRFIRIERTYDTASRTMSTPKNGKARMVDMSRELRQALLDLQGERLDSAIMQGKTDIKPLVFPGKKDLPLSQTRAYAAHRQICSRAGLRAVRVHDLRHSFATIHLYELHSPIQYVSEQLGHSRIGITVDTYGHPTPGMNVSLADQLDGNVRQSAPQVHPGIG